MRSTALFSLVLVASVAKATPVTVMVEVNVSSYFDYPTGTYVSVPTIKGVVSYTFDIDQISVIDHGTTTITRFGGLRGTTWTSPITSLIPNDPYSGAYGPFYSSYSFSAVNDYNSTFIEEGASQATTYTSDGVNVATYYIGVRASRRSPPQDGDGTSDYAFERTSLLDFYRSFAASGEPVYFNESYGTYTLAEGLPVYSDGKSWSDYSGRVIKVIDQAATVPEPSTGLLLVAGWAGLLLPLRRRSAGTSIRRHFMLMQKFRHAVLLTS